MRRPAGVSFELAMARISTHSLHCDGATAGFSPFEIKDIGDWSSLGVLQYIVKSLKARIDLDLKMCASLFDAKLS